MKKDLPLVAREITAAILGERYEASITFVSPREMRRLNRLYRGKDEATDILSFSLGKRFGEILLCASEIRKEAKHFGRSPANFLLFLLIHGLLHLKGLRHGSKMERTERILRKKFGV